jgi:hypothetical protein
MQLCLVLLLLCHNHRRRKQDCRRPSHHEENAGSLVQRSREAVKNRPEQQLRLHRLFHSNRDRDRCADHWVVAHADQAHHLHVRRHGG